MNKFCPLVTSICIGSECHAFQEKIFYKCEVCNDVFQIGGHINKNYNHKRVPKVNHKELRCSYYNIKLKEK